MATKRRSDHLREEAAFLPRSVEDLAELRRRILAAGHPDQVAGGIVGWLVAKAADDPDLTGSPTRSKYRRILAELEPLHPGPDDDELHLVPAAGGAGHGGRRQRGRVRKALVALVVVGAGLGVGGPQRTAGEASAAGSVAVERRELQGSVNQRRRRRDRGGLRRAA